MSKKEGKDIESEIIEKFKKDNNFIAYPLKNCDFCKHFDVITIGNENGRSPYCTLGKFETQYEAICDSFLEQDPI